MQQETAQELFRLDRHHSLVISVGIISPAEGDLVVGEGDQARVGDGDAVRVAGEIAEDMMWTAEWGCGIDDPVLTEQGAQESAEGFRDLHSACTRPPAHGGRKSRANGDKW